MDSGVVVRTNRKNRSCVGPAEGKDRQIHSVGDTFDAAVRISESKAVRCALRLGSWWDAMECSVWQCGP